MTFLPSLLNQDLVRERSRMGRRRAPEERVVRPADALAVAGDLVGAVGRHRVSACPACDAVAAAVTGGDAVGAGAAGDGVAGGAARDRVVGGIAVAAVLDVVAGAPGEMVVAGATVEAVVAVFAAEVVVAVVARDVVVLLG